MRSSKTLEILSPNGRHILSHCDHCTWWDNSRICPEDSTGLFVAFHAEGIMSGKSTKGTVLKVQSVHWVPSGRGDASDMGYAIHITMFHAAPTRKSYRVLAAYWPVGTTCRLYLVRAAGSPWGQRGRPFLRSLKQETWNMQLDIRGEIDRRVSRVLNSILFHPRGFRHM